MRQAVTVVLALLAPLARADGCKRDLDVCKKADECCPVPGHVVCCNRFFDICGVARPCAGDPSKTCCSIDGPSAAKPATQTFEPAKHTPGRQDRLGAPERGSADAGYKLEKAVESRVVRIPFTACQPSSGCPEDTKVCIFSCRLGLPPVNQGCQLHSTNGSGPECLGSNSCCLDAAQEAELGKRARTCPIRRCDATSANPRIADRECRDTDDTDVCSHY